jgi:hypothetical protein
MNKLKKIFQNKPYLAWYINDKAKLSNQTMLEHILNFGDWEDYLAAEKILGLTKTKDIFEELKSKTRVNLRKKTINYFEKYFSRYA